jgi:hypothetical protein
MNLSEAQYHHADQHEHSLVSLSTTHSNPNKPVIPNRNSTANNVRYYPMTPVDPKRTKQKSTITIQSDIKVNSSGKKKANPPVIKVSSSLLQPTMSSKSGRRMVTP